jgi:hypothetical protein
VPGIGPFVAAGTLASTLGAAGLGAAGGGVLGGAAGAIFGAADDDELGDEVSGFYREETTQGRALLSLDVDDAEAMKVASLLRASGAERTDLYVDEGWSEWDHRP